MKYDDFGNLRVKTYTAYEAIPIEEVLVKIYGVDEYNKDEKYSLVTDSDGLTNNVILPAPSRGYSTSPGAKEAPYSVYNVELSKEGFYPKKIENVPIFGGVNAILPIEMLPLSYYQNGSIRPQENLNSVIYENENLQ